MSVDNFFPYPYSGVYFAYRVPTDLEIQNFLNNEESYNAAVRYYNTEVKRYLSPEVKGLFVYPLPGNALHENFLQWVKIVQYLTHTGRVSEDIKVGISPFINLYPGNPHMQWRWLWLKEKPGVPEINDGFEPIFNEQSVVYSKPPKWSPATMYPIDLGNNFIVLQYLTPAELTTAPEIKSTSEDYAYCGDIQLAWELAARNTQAGNFERCRKQYDKRRNLLNKYNVKPQVLSLGAEEKLEDIVELMTTEPIALTTLRKEAEAINWLIEERKSQLADIRALAQRRQETKLPATEEKVVQAQLEQLSREIGEEKGRISTLTRKRKDIETEIAQLHSDVGVREKRIRLPTFTFPLVPPAATSTFPLSSALSTATSTFVFPPAPPTAISPTRTALTFTTLPTSPTRTTLALTAPTTSPTRTTLALTAPTASPTRVTSTFATPPTQPISPTRTTSSLIIPPTSPTRTTLPGTSAFSPSASLAAPTRITERKTRFSSGISPTLSQLALPAPASSTTSTSGGSGTTTSVSTAGAFGGIGAGGEVGRIRGDGAGAGIEARGARRGKRAGTRAGTGAGART